MMWLRLVPFVLLFLFAGILSNAQEASQSVQKQQFGSGPAGGDLSGSYPNAGVDGILGLPPGGSCGPGGYANSLSGGVVPNCGFQSATTICNQNTTSLDATGSTNFTVLAVCALPSGILSDGNGTIETTVLFAFTGSTNGKTVNGYLSNTVPVIGGPLPAASRVTMLNALTAVAANQSAQFSLWIAARSVVDTSIGSQNFPVYLGYNNNGPFIGQATGWLGGPLYVSVGGTLTTASEHLTVERLIVRVLK